MKNLFTIIVLSFYFNTYSQVPIYILNTSSETVEFYLTAHGTNEEFTECEHWAYIIRTLGPTDNIYHDTFDSLGIGGFWTTFIGLYDGPTTESYFGDPIWDVVRFWSPTNGNIGGVLAKSCHEEV